MDDNSIIFDEIDLNYLRDAISLQIATTDWDVTSNGQWSHLVALKNLEEKLNLALDGMYDNQQ